MIWVLFAVESLAVSAVGTVLVAVGLLVVHQPLWLPLVLLVGGALARSGRALPGLVTSWHQAIKRRIEER